MVKIPDYTALGVNNPRPAQGSPSFMGSDPRATALGQLGNMIAGQGMEQLRQQREIDDTLDVAKAQAALHTGLLDVQNQAQADPNYSTFGARYPGMTSKIADSAAAGIRSPRMRALWRARADESIASTNDGITDYGTKLQREDNGVQLRSSLDKLHRIYVDPKVTDEKLKTQTRTEMAGAIKAARNAGLLDPTDEERYNAAYLDGSDKVRAELAVKNDPNAFGGKDATVEGIPPEGAALLNTIAGTESAGNYNIINGGATFSDFSHHPKQGQHGSAGIAAGKYQFLPSTWDRVLKANPDIKDFSPASQDKGAWWLAQDDYRRNTGRDLATDLKSKDANVLAGVRRGLASTWEGLRSKGDGAFASDVSNGKTTFDRTKVDLSNAPDYVKRLSPEDQQSLIDLTEREQAKQGVDIKSGIEIASQNAPAAIQNTGSYTGHMPSAAEFAAAYGPQEGAQRYASFQASTEVAGQIHAFQTEPTADIMQTVKDATPTSTGDTAALDTKKFDAIQTAAAQTIKAREADPSGYVQQAFPNVAKAWADAANSHDYQPALAATAAAQQQLGIQNPELLPASVATDAALATKDETKSTVDRLSPAMSLMSGTNDPGQRKAIFNQMVKAGMPETTEGAFQAWERGDTGAARRLFQAALVDPSKLPGQSPFKPKEIDEAIQSSVMDKGQVGDVYYGLTGGATDNFVKAERDSKLMANAVTLRVRAGEDLESAVAGAAKDLFGDVKTVNETNAQILLPSAADPQPVLDGLTSVMPQVRSTMERNMAAPDAKGSDKAVMGAVTSNYVDRVMAEGYFRNSGNGFVFIDPFVGAAVSDENGKPVIFTEKDFAKPVPATAASNYADPNVGIRDAVMQSTGQP